MTARNTHTFLWRTACGREGKKDGRPICLDSSAPLLGGNEYILIKSRLSKFSALLNVTFASPFFVIRIKNVTVESTHAVVANERLFIGAMIQPSGQSVHDPG